MAGSATGVIACGGRCRNPCAVVSDTAAGAIGDANIERLSTLLEQIAEWSITAERNRHLKETLETKNDRL